jgi:DNA topoisomerase II
MSKKIPNNMGESKSTKAAKPIKSVKKKLDKKSLIKKNLAKKYQKKTDIEHILDAPDTYIGSVEPDLEHNWLLNDKNKMEWREYTWTAGFYKCFDEGIVNCRDHKIRLDEKIKNGDKNIIPVKNIEITVNKDTGVITMYNDGNGIDIAKHPEYLIWIPEMIFGHLRTGSNYDKSEKKIVGGKNGFGFKLVLIYALWGEIETVDHIRKLKYVQRFENNLSKICKPKVTKTTVKPYTKVSWLPDYKRFGMEGLTDDLFNLLKKRTLDISAVTDKTVRVKFNDEYFPIKSFEQYVDLYIGAKSETKRIYEKPHNRWEIIVCLSPLDEFTQVSFVNGIHTKKGGKHIEYIINQIVKKMVAYIEKKKKIKVKPITIKEQLMLFLNCVIENPAFDSQTKETLNTPLSKFGSKCEISDKFIDKLAKMGVMDAAICLNEVKANKAARKCDGRKTNNIRGIPKLMDANKAGGSQSHLCTLILSEGDSAKAGIVSGLSKDDRNFYGVFPLKGKLLNTRDISQTRVNNNAEITNIKKILGLETGKKYDTNEKIKKHLRYGKVLFMTDQDLDGAHIKGLCINMFQSQWPELIKLDGFMGFMNTPILKAKKGTRELSFYTENKYHKWKDKNNGGKGWKIKYFKGLGTSSAKEFKEYFKKKKMVTFEYESDVTCGDSIAKVFDKTRADDRKVWLGNYNRDDVLDVDKDKISYTDFVDKEMKHFSKYDCDRSIPNMVDGWKISTRKILFSCFKRNLVNEIKVAQLSGYISEHSGYHHGEMSLIKGIIGMAQEYVGSNNVNVLMPNGQFGSRLMGGKDHASERYIFTALNPMTKFIFREEDKAILNYQNDDGLMVEPDYYVPIIPYVLVNGGKGIGTGFSYEGLSYNVSEIITYLRNKINNIGTNIELHPYYEGFNGTVIKNYEHSKKYLIKGKYEIVNSDTIKITELPIGSWTTDYNEFLEYLMSDKSKNGKKKIPIIKKKTDLCTDVLIEFTVKFYPGILPGLISTKYNEHINMLEKTMNLTTTKSLTNMNLFTETHCLKKYDNVYDIFDDYYIIRKAAYNKRKEYIINNMQYIVKKITNKAKFILEQCEDVIDLRKKKKEEVIEILKSRGYDVLDGDEEFKYLRTMRIEQVEEENMNKLLKEKAEKIQELNILKNTTIENMWLTELKELETTFKKYKTQRRARQFGIKTKKVKKVEK